MNELTQQWASPSATEKFEQWDKVKELLHIILGQRKDLANCLKKRVRSASLEELPQLILVQALSCLRAKRLTQVELLQVLQSWGHLTTTAWELTAFENLDLINDIRKKCESFDVASLKDFLATHTDQTIKKNIIKAVFYGSWFHILAWANEEGEYQKLFPKLHHLLKIAIKSDGEKRISIILSYASFLKDDLELTGYAIGQLAVNGDIETKVSYLLKTDEIKDNPEKPVWKFLKDDLELTGYAIGQLTLTGDIETKISYLLKTGNIENEPEKPVWKFLKDDLELTGSSIGQLAVSGDIETKISYLLKTGKIENEPEKPVWRFLKDDLELTGSSIGQLTLTGDIETKISYLLKTGKIENEPEKPVWRFLKDDLELTGYAIGQLAVNGDIETKISYLLKTGKIENEPEKPVWRFLKDDLELTGYAIGQLTLTGDIETKISYLLKTGKIENEPEKPVWRFLKDDLELTGYAIGQLTLTGDIETKISYLLKTGKIENEPEKPVWKFLKDDLELTGSSIGQLAVSGDIETKISYLLKTGKIENEPEKPVWRFLKDDLELTGSSIGQLTLTGDIETKVSYLLKTGKIENEPEKPVWKFLKDDLELTGSSIGQLTLTGDIETKVSYLLKTGKIENEPEKPVWKFLKDDLELTGSSIGQLTLTGDIETKVSYLLKTGEIENEPEKPVWRFLKDDLELTGYAIGQLAVNGDIETKVSYLLKTDEMYTIKSLKITGYKLGLVFVSAQKDVIEGNLRLLSALKTMLDNNSSFNTDVNSVTFPQVFTKSLAGYVITQKWTTSNSEFVSLVKFFEEVDFHKLFIQTSGKSTQELKTYVELLTTNEQYQYLLLTYLTGNKSVGQKQWAMLKKVMSGGGRGFSPFSSAHVGSDGEPIPDDRDIDLADSFDLEATVIQNLDYNKILHSFFDKYHIQLTNDEVQSMQSFTSGLSIEVDESFLDKLLPMFGDAEIVKQFLLGEMEPSQIQALSENL